MLPKKIFILSNKVISNIFSTVQGSLKSRNRLSLKIHITKYISEVIGIKDHN